MSKRKPGEKNYADDQTQIYDLRTQVPPATRTGLRHHLEVEQVVSAPPSYVVRDTKGNEWYVMTTADDALEIVEASEDAYHNVTAWVLKAVERYRTKNH